MTNEAAHTKCSLCLGEKTVWDTYQWSDGLGGVQVRCPQCVGTGDMYADPAMEALAQEKRKVEHALARLQAEHEKLQENVMCFMDSLESAKYQFVRGLPGASTQASTWKRYLETTVRPHRQKLEADLRQTALREHEAFHTKPVHPESPSGAARTYCALCNPPKNSSRKH